VLTEPTFSKPPKNYIKLSVLVYLALASLLFSRVLSLVGIPALFANFAHFIFVPAICVYALAASRTRDRQQIDTMWALLIGLLALLAEIIFSALLNKTGMVNIALAWLLQAEPFIMLLALVSLPLPANSVQWLRKWIFGFCFLNIVVSYFQGYAIPTGNPDDLKGLFLSVAGVGVSTLVLSIFCIYFFISAKNTPLWARSLVIASVFWLIILADSKQIFLFLLAAFLLMSLTEAKPKSLFPLISGILLCFGLYWCISNVPAFSAFNVWNKPELYSGDSSPFLLARTVAFRVIAANYTSPLHLFFGLGPGHTTGRLGGWMMENYWSILEPLGATKTLISDSIVTQGINEYGLGLILGTSLFNPLTSWAGIWGDFGLFGLLIYFFLWGVVWQNLCVDRFSKFIVLLFLISGFSLTWMEEPGYSLFTTFIIGLRWHEHQLKKIQSSDLLQQF
jgi:hypothetical protein